MDCFFVLADINGNIFYKQNPKSASSSSAANYQPGAFEWPQEDKGFAILGAFKVATNASGAFTAGTTSLAAANQVVTYYNAGNDLGVPIPY